MLQFPTIFKQEGTGAFTNLRDSLEEHSWQVAYVKPKVVFIENSLLDTYHGMLRGQGCTVVVMDPLDGPVPEGVLQFWDVINVASDEDNEVALDQHEHTAILRFTGGTTGRGKCAMYPWTTIWPPGIAATSIQFSSMRRRASCMWRRSPTARCWASTPPLWVAPTSR